MDNTVKEYEQRQLEQCVNMNVRSVGNMYLPQAQAFGISWSNAKDRDYSPWCTEECHRDTTGQRSPSDPTDKMMDDKGPVVVPAQALERTSGLDARTLPSMIQGNALQLNQTKKVQAG